MVQGDTSFLTKTQTHHRKHRQRHRDSIIRRETLTNLAAMEELSPQPQTLPASFIHSFRQQQKRGGGGRQGSREEERKRRMQLRILAKKKKSPCEGGW